MLMDWDHALRAALVEDGKRKEKKEEPGSVLGSSLESVEYEMGGR